HQESDRGLLCRVAVEYFVRLKRRPQGSLSPTESELLFDLAHLLSTGCEIDKDIQAEAAALLLDRQRQIEKSEIKIGCLLPLSGPNAVAGARFLRGMEIALEVYPRPVPGAGKPALKVQSSSSPSSSSSSSGETVAVTPAAVTSETGYNSSSPSLPRVKVFLYDTAGEGEQARAGVDYLVHEKKVSLLLGPYTGKAANYAAAQAQSLGVTMISLSPLLHSLERYQNVFQHCPTIRNQAVSLAELSRARLGIRKFALLVPRNRYGREFAEKFVSQVESWGGQVVRQVEYDASRPDFGPAIRELIGERRYRRFKEKRKDYEAWLKRRQRQRQAAKSGAQLEPDGADKLADLARKIGIDGAELNIISADEIMPRPLLRCDFEALVIPDREQTLKLLIPQLAFYDLDECFLLGGRYWNNTEFLDSLANFAEGSFFVGASLPPVTTGSESEAFVSDPQAEIQAHFQADFSALNRGEIPGLLELYGYDTIMLLRKLAVNIDPQADAETWRQLLAGCRDLSLASGLTTTLDDGEIAKKLYPLMFRKGKITLVSESCF
ncbi:MAG TPA: amino acid ABC transporter substrate-binding protein, partial [Desulfarculaceae bacterium]|nr:amino acid ABC transporter substrate-binding protein [Desulfarculaceae bacterium]